MLYFIQKYPLAADNAPKILPSMIRVLTRVQSVLMMDLDSTAGVQATYFGIMSNVYQVGHLTILFYTVY